MVEFLKINVLGSKPELLENNLSKQEDLIGTNVTANIFTALM